MLGGFAWSSTHLANLFIYLGVVIDGHQITGEVTRELYLLFPFSSFLTSTICSADGHLITSYAGNHSLSLFQK